LTFFASDCYAELYGRRAAQVLVNVGFLMNFVFLALLWATILAPAFPNSPVSAATFRAALGPSTGVVVGSLVAYLVSQNWDVVAFHRIREYTEGRALWLRNLGSTATSQLLDAAVFIAVAFVGFQGLPLGTAVALFVGQYLFRIAIAVLDTPFVYAVVGLARRQGVAPAEEGANAGWK
ncbi:MAG: queuosine precursor transporter, partial [Halobacteriaceae archaeon]